MMIKKLDPYNSSKSSTDGYHWEYRPNMEDVINKVNEIIDAVNANSFGFSIPRAYSRFPFLGVDPGDTEKSEPVRHGHWIDAYPKIEPNPMFKYGICSVCGYEQSVSKYLKFCPNCGAKMDEAEYERTDNS